MYTPKTAITIPYKMKVYRVKFADNLSYPVTHYAAENIKQVMEQTEGVPSEVTLIEQVAQAVEFVDGNGRASEL